MKIKTKFILLYLILNSVLGYNQSFVVADNQTKEVLPFASYHSCDNRCFGYSDFNGIIKKCSNFDTLIVNYLGYQKGVFINHFNKNNIDTLFLKKRSYLMDEITITTDKVDIYKELSKILKDIKNKSFHKEVNTLFYLESTESGKLIERIELITNDLLTNKKLKFNSRILGDFLIDKRQPYFSLDIDIFLKNIPFFIKKSKLINHIFSKKKINKKKYNLTLLKTSEVNTREVFYTQNKPKGTTGVIKYNYKTNEIIEHLFVFHNTKTKVYSLNRNVSTTFDSLKIHYKFDANKLSNFTYTMWITKGIGSEKRKVTLRGFIKILDIYKFEQKIEIPCYQYESLQEEIIFTDKIWNKIPGINLLFKVDNSIFKKKELSMFLNYEDSLSYEIFNYLNVLRSKRKIWNPKIKLTHKDYILKNAIPQLGGRGKITFLSDLHKPKIYWIIIPFYNNKNKLKYLSPNSIWDVKNSNILFYDYKQSTWIANITFDIFEFYRKKLIDFLNNNNVKYPEIKIREYYDKASYYVNKLTKSSKYGVDTISYSKIFNDLQKNINNTSK